MQITIFTETDEIVRVIVHDKDSENIDFMNLGDLPDHLNFVSIGEIER